MTIGAVVLVKDEIDLLRRNLAHHSSIGVDCFLLSDRGSNEESQALLEDLARPANVHLFRQDVYAVRGIDSESMKAVRLAALNEMRHVFSPDWLFPMDTDEFWVPRSGSLRDVVRGAQVDHFSVHRFNAALTRGTSPAMLEGVLGEALLEQEIIVKRRQHSRQTVEANPEAPWIFHAIVPKFMTSRRDIVEVEPGFHDVQCSRQVTRGWPQDLLIIHFPFTTFDRFARKVHSVRRHLEHIGPTFKGDQAWHWRRWAALHDDRALRDEFDRQFFDPIDLEALRQRGEVMKAADYLASLASKARPESSEEEAV